MYKQQKLNLMMNPRDYSGMFFWMKCMFKQQKKKVEGKHTQ